jgi:hypothetical protein
MSETIVQIVALFRSLGFEKMTVVFEQPRAT